MTAGLALVVVLALVLFIGVSALVLVTGLFMDASEGDDMAKTLVYAAYLLLWLIPSIGTAVGWWMAR